MDWKVFYTTNKSYKVTLIKDLLFEEGIECREISKKDTTLQFGDIELYVQEENVSKAEEIIKNHPEL